MVKQYIRKSDRQQDTHSAQQLTARITSFGYDSGTLVASDSIRRGLHDEATKLLNAFAELRNPMDKVNSGT